MQKRYYQAVLLALLMSLSAVVLAESDADYCRADVRAYVQDCVEQIRMDSDNSIASSEGIGQATMSEEAPSQE
jgi:hypothetical protein